MELFELVLMAYVQAFSDNETKESILEKVKAMSFDEIDIYLHLQH